MLLSLIASYYISNAIYYDAFNFEHTPLYSDLAKNMGNSTLAEFWVKRVSGESQRILLLASMVDVLINMASPVYSLHIPALLLYIVARRRYVKVSAFNKMLIVIMILTFIIYSYGRTYININVYKNIFVIRYYVPLVLIFYIFIMTMLRDDNIDKLFLKLIILTNILFYLMLFISQGWFMKEKILLTYNGFQEKSLSTIAMLVIVTLFFIMLDKLALLNRKILFNIHVQKNIKFSITLSCTKIITMMYYIAAIIFFLTLLYPIVKLHLMLNMFTVDTDSTYYNFILNKFFPEFFSYYFVSYYENDEILSKVPHTCFFIYSFGGIYSVTSYRSRLVLIRGGHFGYLPLILADLKFLNKSNYKFIIQKYLFLNTFELPNIICVQIPRETHAEKSILPGLTELAKCSPIFLRMWHVIENEKPILETQFYRVYLVKLKDQG